MSSDKVIPIRTVRIIIGLVVTLGLGSARTGQSLPGLNLDLAQTTVSGLSSGGFMAMQLHVAFSESLMGAGIVAGGPYYCAEDNLGTALTRCMDPNPIVGEPDPARLLSIARDAADARRIDVLNGLVGDRVYIFSGTRDETVALAVVASVKAFYTLAGVPESAIVFEHDLAAGHALITDDYGGACDETASPFINDCDYDQAGAILGHLYGPAALAPPATDLSGRFLALDQAELLADPEAHSMGRVGYAYVPAACEAGEQCRVHVALHGCSQTTGQIGDAFYAHGGYNEWADSNRIVVLYPQAVAGPGNPKGCWDFWGYDGSGYHTRSAPQMAMIDAMVRLLAGATAPDDGIPPTYCAEHSARKSEHLLAGRLRWCKWWYHCATGSDEVVGWAYDLFSYLTLYESQGGHFSTEPCFDQ